MLVNCKKIYAPLLTHICRAHRQEGKCQYKIVLGEEDCHGAAIDQYGGCLSCANQGSVNIMILRESQEQMAWWEGGDALFLRTARGEKGKEKRLLIGGGQGHRERKREKKLLRVSRC